MAARGQTASNYDSVRDQKIVHVRIVLGAILQ
jgi:hypothetical protein